MGYLVHLSSRVDSLCDKIGKYIDVYSSPNAREHAVRFIRVSALDANVDRGEVVNTQLCRHESSVQELVTMKNCLNWFVHFI